MGATIKDVAKMAQTSIATVSRYINGKEIKEKTRSRIDEAIIDLNYEINSNARGLKTNRSMLIGTIVPHLNHIYDITIIKGIQNFLIKFGYNLLILESNGNLKEEKIALEFLYKKNVDGIIINSDSEDINIYSDFIKDDIPIVLIDQKLDNINTNAVVADNINAVYQAVEYLIKMGHRKISIILGTKGCFTAKERLTGYLRAMEDYGLEVDNNMIKHGNYKSDGGYLAMKELLEGNVRPTAIIATNYDMTHGALMALNEKNLSIPGDISFIGYDDINLAEIYRPKFTIIMQPMIQMGEKAASLMIKMIKNNVADYGEIYRLKNTFIINDSVAKI